MGLEKREEVVGLPEDCEKEGRGSVWKEMFLIYQK